uniref:Uncharacterized protein n=1 Tax=Anguilla anguilla TaxID=7936 RepID=A0A0E9PB76_ANGAN
MSQTQRSARYRLYI